MRSLDARPLTKTQSMAILKSEAPKNGLVFEERVITGHLNEVYLLLGIQREESEAKLSAALDQLTADLTVF